MSSGQQPEPIEGIVLTYPESPVVADVLDQGALLLVSFFEGRFRKGRQELAKAQEESRAAWRSGQPGGFLVETEAIRTGDWKIEPAPSDFESRRVEIVSTLESSTLVNALGSGADACIVDFRDSFTSDTSTLLRGQLRLRQAVNGTLAYHSPLGTVVIGDSPSKIVVRPRRLTETEPCLAFEGHPVSAGILDVLLFLAHCGKGLVEKGETPCFEVSANDQAEAKLWSEVLDSAETLVRLPRGTIRTSVVIESVGGVFQADEIAHELKDRLVGIAHGTWRYVRDFLECFPNEPRATHPDRSTLFTALDYLRFSSRYLVQVAHKRNTFALAPCFYGDSVDTPTLRIVGESLVEELAADLEEGYDGKRLCCSKLLSVVRRCFDTAGVATHQMTAFPYAEGISTEDLLRVNPRPITESGFRNAIRTGLAQIAGWIAGHGTTRLDYSLETSSSAGVSRLLLRQWMRHPNGILSDGVEITKAYVREVFAEELRNLTGREEEFGFDNEQLLAAVRIFASSLAEDATTDSVLDAIVAE